MQTCTDFFIGEAIEEEPAAPSAYNVEWWAKKVYVEYRAVGPSIAALVVSEFYSEAIGYVPKSYQNRDRKFLFGLVKETSSTLADYHFA